MAVSTRFWGIGEPRAMEAVLLDHRSAPAEDVVDLAPTVYGDVQAPKNTPVRTIEATRCPLAPALGLFE